VSPPPNPALGQEERPVGPVKARTNPSVTRVTRVTQRLELVLGRQGRCERQRGRDPVKKSRDTGDRCDAYNAQCKR